MRLVETIRAQNTLGECVLWNERSGMLWWTDIQARQLLSYRWADKTLRCYATPERVGAFGFVENSARLIVAFESGLALYDPEQKAIDWLARLEPKKPGVRFNDGRVDRQGRFWVGTMIETSDEDLEAHLYCLDCAGRLRQHERGIKISNGLCFSPDGMHLYFADSPRRSIHVYDLIEPAGTLSNRRLFAQTPAGADPDGAIVDAEGHVWSAHWGGGCVVRYSPNGHIERILEVPASQPTCVAFGGPDLKLLFVSSARAGLSSETLASQPDAGSVFVYDVGVQGLPEPQYRYTPAASPS